MTFLQRLDHFARLCLPVGLTLFLVLLAITPLQITGFAPVAPLIVLGSLYYWAVYRPHVMPLYMVFLVGLLEDILTGAPLGMNALIYLMAFGLVASQRRFLLNKSFGVVWWGFMLVAATVAGLRLLVIAAMGGMMPDPMPGLFSYFSTVAAYPFLTVLFASVHRLLPQPYEGV